jgi:tRNA(fMet)-specific endonuclease VapC
MNNPRYLLDTNILSDLIRNPQGAVKACIARVGETTVCTNTVVSSELRFGALKKGSKKLTERVELVLFELDILALDDSVSRHYAMIRHHLQKNGQPIGYNDLFIAAHALALNLTLVTDNVREFSRVPELAMENWLAAQT